MLPVLARKGFDGVTTRELAIVSGISEALIFRHFPTKDQLCAEIYDYCSNTFELNYARIAQLAPSAQSLAKLVYFVIRGIVVKRAEGSEAAMRLLYRSMLEDGRYASQVFGGRQLALVRKQFSACLAAAQGEGDATALETPIKDLFWFTHHTASLVCLVRLGDKPVVTYGGSVETLVGELTRFSLRGIGLSDAGIRKYAGNAVFAQWLRSPELTLLSPLPEVGKPTSASRKSRRTPVASAAVQRSDRGRAR